MHTLLRLVTVLLAFLFYALEVFAQGNPMLLVDQTSLNFAYDGNVMTANQRINVNYDGPEGIHWTVNCGSWISMTPCNGYTPGTIEVGVNPAGLEPGMYSGEIIVEGDDQNAIITVNLTVMNEGSSQDPFGTLSTPTDGSVVSSSIPVTGWALDDIGVENIKIYRTGSPGLIYVGDAFFVDGARPDVEMLYPDFPQNYNAGWGYMLLTNFLPDGPTTLTAIATDAEGHQVTLGAKSITIDNANAVKPFGAIDTPAQGGSASGTEFVNWGWVLTPQPNTIPTDGSTIKVYVDGVQLPGNPNYNIYRNDIATLFPGYSNSNGAVGYYYFDTTTYSNGVHTIQWTVSDNAGNTDGIGSRYFSVENSERAPSRSSSSATRQSVTALSEGQSRALPRSSTTTIDMGSEDLLQMDVAALLGTSGGTFTGFTLKDNGLSGPLPIGSTLDAINGIFYWQPGPAFNGHFTFRFYHTDVFGQQTTADTNVTRQYPTASPTPARPIPMLSDYLLIVLALSLITLAWLRLKARPG